MNDRMNVAQFGVIIPVQSSIFQKYPLKKGKTLFDKKNLLT
jgi:hypothetical protein